MRTEHIATAPRGWHVRMIVPGPRSEHRVAIAFPPGARKKGSGKLVEILHPAGEKANPSCEVSKKAKSNPSELLIFGNPSKLAAQRGARERAEKIRSARLNPDLFDSIGPRDKVTFLNRFNQAQTGRVVMRSSHGGWVLNMGGAHGTPAVIDRNTPITKVRKTNDGQDVFKKHQIAIAKATLRMSDAGARIMGGMTKEQAREILRKFGVRFKAENPKRSGTAQLTPAENKVWERAFEYYLNEGKTDLQADKLAAREVEREFPRLKAFKKYAPNPNGETFYVQHTDTDANKIRFIGPFTEKIAKEKAAHFDRVGHKGKVIPTPASFLARGIPLAKRNPKRATPRRRRADRQRRNPDESRAAVRLFQKFHGRDPKDISEEHVSAAIRKDYTALGDLEYLAVVTPLGKPVWFHFENDGVKLASSPDGKQLYCIGGNQNLAQCLDKDSLEKDFIDLGEAIEVQYLARKIHGNFEPISYFHKFGEKTGARPQLAYDKLKKQIFFVGGEYLIDIKKGISPGIEN